MIIAVMNATKAIAYRSMKKSGLQHHNCDDHSSLDFKIRRSIYENISYITSQQTVVFF